MCTLQESKGNEDTSQRPNEKGRAITQVVACLAAAIGSLSAGTMTGWTGATLPALTSDLDMNTNETAWTVSIIQLGCVVGSTASGKIMNFCGRRGTLLIIAPVIVTGWLTIGFAPSTPVLLLGRLLCGITSAFLFTTVPVYCSEVLEARLRGRLATLSSLFLSFGNVWSYVVGAFFTWRNTCYICTVPVVLMVTALCAVPESPYWYLMKGRKEDCKTALKWLRGPTYDSSTELAEMEVKMNSVGNKAEFRELLRPRTRRPFVIALYVSTLQQGCGIEILMTFTGMIFITAGVDDHLMATVYTGIMQIAFSVVGLLTVDHLGRKPLIITSTTVVGVATTVLGVHYLMNDVVGLMWPSWVPMVSVLTAVAGYCLGLRTITWIMSAELFNTVIRSTAITATICYNRTLGLTILQVYPFFQEAFGAHTVFFTFGCLNLMASLLSLIIVPETKGKTLEEIQAYFESPKKNADTKKNFDSEIYVTHL